MGFVTLRLAASALGRRYRNTGPGFRAEPEVVTLGVRPGVAPSDRPPVRIFLGTEPAQYRAERVFVWSIEQVRDPSRVYEIHLMKNLEGFDRQLWLTGFTNYRFAIPHLAGRTGRAIYNDVDQIYLADPALLFDAEMDGHGYLSISDADTSVMLIDCERMADIWPLEATQRERRKALEARARAVPGLWGRLAPEWNARDEEYVAGQTCCLHYTTLHTQPWRPFPEEYVYRENPVAEVWHALERSADAAGYLPFTAERPTRGYRRLLTNLAEAPAYRPAAETATGDDAGSVLVYGFGAARGGADAAAGGPTLRFDPVEAETPVPPPADTVLCPAGTLELLPDEDTLWTLDLLFGAARERVAIRIGSVPAASGLPAVEARSAEWWRRRVATIAAWHPGIEWELTIGTGRRERVFRGGRRPQAAPAVWVLASEKAGHTSQAIGLAEALGWPYAVKEIRLHPAALFRPDAERRVAARLGLNRRSDSEPRWPDLAIASGWLGARVARLLRRMSGGRTRVVLMGRKAGPIGDHGEIGVALAHFGLMPHPRRIETILPPSRVTPKHLVEAAKRWPDLFAGEAQPRVVLLVGGSASFHRLDPQTAARMAREVSDWTAAAGGSLTAVTSRRTGAAATAALRSALADKARLHEWRADASENPYLGYLAGADVIVVTGESESMLAEAVATGKPVYIYPLPEAPRTAWQRLGAWVARQATTAHINKRGTPRPQQGLEYLCARLIERGWVLPPRDIAAMHANAVGLGVARMFGGEPLQRWNPTAFDPTVAAAARVRELLDAPVPARGGAGQAVPVSSAR